MCGTWFFTTLRSGLRATWMHRNQLIWDNCTFSYWWCSSFEAGQVLYNPEGNIETLLKHIRWSRISKALRVIVTVNYKLEMWIAFMLYRFICYMFIVLQIYIIMFYRILQNCSAIVLTFLCIFKIIYNEYVFVHWHSASRDPMARENNIMASSPHCF